MEDGLQRLGATAMQTRVATEKGNTIVLFRVLDVTDLLLPGPGSASGMRRRIQCTLSTKGMDMMPLVVRLRSVDSVDNGAE
jgi:hypothetical protein